VARIGGRRKLLIPGRFDAMAENIPQQTSAYG
jgi:hypothetical protein